MTAAKKEYNLFERDGGLWKLYATYDKLPLQTDSVKIGDRIMKFQKFREELKDKQLPVYIIWKTSARNYKGCREEEFDEDEVLESRNTKGQHGGVRMSKKAMNDAEKIKKRHATLQEAMWKLLDDEMASGKFLFEKPYKALEAATKKKITIGCIEHWWRKENGARKWAKGIEVPSLHQCLLVLKLDMEPPQKLKDFLGDQATYNPVTKLIETVTYPKYNREVDGPKKKK